MDQFSFDMQQEIPSVMVTTPTGMEYHTNSTDATHQRIDAFLSSIIESLQPVLHDYCISHLSASALDTLWAGYFALYHAPDDPPMRKLRLLQLAGEAQLNQRLQSMTSAKEADTMGLRLLLGYLPWLERRMAIIPFGQTHWNIQIRSVPTDVKMLTLHMNTSMSR